MKPANLIVSFNPHTHSGTSISGIYGNILLALVPATLLGVAHYGMDALRVVCISIASAMLAEMLIQRAMGRPVTIADGSAATSGLLLGLLLPASVPLYLVVVANAIGILVGKQVFGGLGAHPLNPALVGWAVVRITKTWSGLLDFDLSMANYDPGFILQYPLAVLKAKGAEGIAHLSRSDLFWGRQLGGIGAASTVWLLLGGLYVTLRGFVRWQIPLFFLAGVALMSGIFWMTNGALYGDPLFHLLTGNVMIGAFFLATDSSSSPVNPWALVAYGIGCGVLTVILRAWSVYPDGVVFAILLMNLFVPLLDKLRRRPAIPSVQPLGGEESAS